MKGIYSFIIKVVFVCLGIVLFYAIIYRMGYRPLYTDSVSFDAKIDYAKTNAPSQIQMMAIGSSMTLNNVNSETILNNGIKSYFNFSAWGLQMMDLGVMLTADISKYDCKYVLISSTIVDFEHKQDKSVVVFFNTNNILRENFKSIFYYRNFNPVTEIINRKNVLANLRSDSVHQTSLTYDSRGGVPLNLMKNGIYLSVTPVEKEFPTAYTEDNYKALDAFANMLASKGIKLFFVQAPIRNAFQDQPKAAKLLNHHFEICRAIVEKDKGMYIKIQDRDVFTDSLFVDNFHLKKEGAKLYTQKLLEQIKPVIK